MDSCSKESLWNMYSISEQYAQKTLRLEHVNLLVSKARKYNFGSSETDLRELNAECVEVDLANILAIFATVYQTF